MLRKYSKVPALSNKTTDVQSQTADFSVIVSGY